MVIFVLILFPENSSNGILAWLLKSPENSNMLEMTATLLRSSRLPASATSMLVSGCFLDFVFTGLEETAKAGRGSFGTFQ